MLVLLTTFLHHTGTSPVEDICRCHEVEYLMMSKPVEFPHLASFALGNALLLIASCNQNDLTLWEKKWNVGNEGTLSLSKALCVFSCPIYWWAGALGTTSAVPFPCFSISPPPSVRIPPFLPWELQGSAERNEGNKGFERDMGGYVESMGAGTLGFLTAFAFTPESFSPELEVSLKRFRSLYARTHSFVGGHCKLKMYDFCVKIRDGSRKCFSLC